MDTNIGLLPPAKLEETKKILKKLNSTHRHLALLNGIAKTIPNQSILIDTLSLQEAKDSSAIENIITTHDELYKAQLFQKTFKNAEAKEINCYADALKYGYSLLNKNKLLTVNHLLEVQSILEQNDAGFRKLPGTALVNESTGETIYTPPQAYDTIVALMNNLIEYINNDDLHDVDPLVKMAVIHYQFETIHPFYDGNGRTGRIINILYLVLQNLLSIPVLYLSRYIINNKLSYYRLLQKVRDTGLWEEWILYMLDAVEETSKETLAIIDNMRVLMLDYKHRIRNMFPKMYSQDLINNLFRHPYTKIEFLMNDLKVSRITATKYLDELAKSGFLVKEKIWKSNFYINMPLFMLFKGESKQVEDAPPIVTQNLDRK